MIADLYSQLLEVRIRKVSRLLPIFRVWRSQWSFDLTVAIVTYISLYETGAVMNQESREVSGGTTLPVKFWQLIDSGKGAVIPFSSVPKSEFTSRQWVLWTKVPTKTECSSRFTHYFIRISMILENFQCFRSMVILP